MNLTQAREGLAAVLASALPVGVSVMDHLPDSITPPCALVGWRNPWVKPATLCAYESRMEVICVAQRIEPGGKLQTLEEMLGAVIPALKQTPGYAVEDATNPYPLEYAGVLYLASSINITHDCED